ncbi:MAG: DUF3891 family protein [Bacillaceae bacterium]|nr:DUF3891 family protein [Bacillaceae bacterium]
MIVRNKQDFFLLFKQHDHGLASGEMARYWKREFFIRPDLRREVEYATANHDRAWIPLDHLPLWNDSDQKPYSFIDYPLEEKINHYEQGIDEVQDKTNYGAVLCSMHYSSFFPKNSSQAVISSFISREISRRERIFDRMITSISDDEVAFHFHLLQFCDDLSLYICMNEPGVQKERELSWFRDGFRQKFSFARNGMMAKWEDRKTISVDPFPFEEAFYVSIPFVKVLKRDIKEKGLDKAYQQGEKGELRVRIIRKQG